MHKIEWLGVFALALGLASGAQVVERFAQERITGEDAIGSAARRGEGSGRVRFGVPPVERISCRDFTASELGLAGVFGSDEAAVPLSGFVHGSYEAFMRNRGDGQIAGDLFGVRDEDLKRYLLEQPATQTISTAWGTVHRIVPSSWADTRSAAENALRHARAIDAFEVPGYLLRFFVMDPVTSAAHVAGNTLRGGGALLAAAGGGDCVTFGETLRSGVNDVPEAVFALTEVAGLAGGTAKVMRRAITRRSTARAIAVVARTASEARARWHALVAPRKQPHLAGGWCFTGGTAVHTPRGLVAIERISLGDRVLTMADATDAGTGVDASWRRIELEMKDPRSADGMLHIALLRPSTWVDHTRASVGETIHLALEEIDVRGEARVVSLGAAPRIEAGPGRVVLSTIASESASVLELHFEGTNEVLEPTAGHRLFSVDRNSWTRADELRIGERLHTRGGRAVVASIERKPGTHRVYNVEVETDHSYLVGKLGVLTHNFGGCDAGEASASAQRDVYFDYLSHEQNAVLERLAPTASSSPETRSIFRQFVGEEFRYRYDPKRFWPRGAPAPGIVESSYGHRVLGELEAHRQFLRYRGIDLGALDPEYTKIYERSMARIAALEELPRGPASQLTNENRIARSRERNHLPRELGEKYVQETFHLRSGLSLLEYHRTFQDTGRQLASSRQKGPMAPILGEATRPHISSLPFARLPPHIAQYLNEIAPEAGASRAYLDAYGDFVFRVYDAYPYSIGDERRMRAIRSSFEDFREAFVDFQTTDRGTPVLGRIVTRQELLARSLGDIGYPPGDVHAYDEAIAEYARALEQNRNASRVGAIEREGRRALGNVYMDLVEPASGRTYRELAYEEAEREWNELTRGGAQ